MQTRHESFLRAINNQSAGYNILTFATHERYMSNWSTTPHTFYLYQGKNIKPWSNNYAQLPANHILLNGKPDQIKGDMKIDIVLSQNKFGQFSIANDIAQRNNVPLISIEHTLPVPEWNTKQRKAMLSMKGKLNLFISKFSINEWGFNEADPSVRVIEHGVDTDIFKPSENWNPDGKILSVVNDHKNRTWCCGWDNYIRITNGLPLNPVGSTPGWSEPAKNIDDLVSKYQNASVFINTSLISPVPTALLEAMSCECPIVTTATCMIPEIVVDGYNGFISNDESYLRDRVIWCLTNPDKAKMLGKNARKTILERFSLDVHLDKWNKVFKEVYGTGYRQ